MLIIDSMKHFDSHVHIGLINDDPMEQLLVIQKTKQQHVNKMLSICNNLIDFDNVYNNLISEASVYHAVGVSPSEVTHPGKDWERKIEERAALRGVVAIGETGLDYHYQPETAELQQLRFKQHVELAVELAIELAVEGRVGARWLEVAPESACAFLLLSTGPQSQEQRRSGSRAPRAGSRATRRWGRSC